METKITSVREQQGKHPELVTKLLDEAARLRERAREILRTPAPPPMGTDKSETFAKLWAEAWKSECGLVADRLGDAAKILEDGVAGPQLRKFTLRFGETPSDTITVPLCNKPPFIAKACLDTLSWRHAPLLLATSRLVIKLQKQVAA